VDEIAAGFSPLAKLGMTVGVALLSLLMTAGVIPIVHALTKRFFASLDEQQKATLTAIGRLDAKLEGLAVTDRSQESAIVELRVRVAQQEEGLGRLEQKYDDIAGFLQGEGFRRRTGREG